MGNFEERFDRSILLLGEESYRKLAGARVLVLGLGGVGGYVVENLARAGVGHLTLADGDTVDISNSNRQLSALQNTLGEAKAEVWRKRCCQINPDGDFTARPSFVRSGEEIEELLSTPFDFAVDAIDELQPKIAFLLTLRQRKIPFVSAMGAGGKTDPSQVRCADISKSYGCPLARAVRKELRERGVTKGVPVVFSPETPLRRFAGKTIGSISYLPAVFGCFCAFQAIKSLIQEKNA